MGKTIYTGVILLFLFVVGALIYPTVYSITSSVDVSGWLPINQAAMIGFTYFFLFFIMYLSYRKFKGDD